MADSLRMNFLAHLHLALPTPESRMGNLLGDFVKGNPWDERFPLVIWQGIMEHRLVDSFTDKSDVWNESKDLLPVNLRRYAGIIIDVFYDYFLHRHWRQFSHGGSIDAFVESVHRDLVSALPWAPPHAASAIRRMICEEWLLSYRKKEGVDITLKRIARRSPALSVIAEAVAYLEQFEGEMEQHFLRFYPELQTYVTSIRPVSMATFQPA